MYAIRSYYVFTVYAPQVSALIKNQDWETLQMKYVETAKLLFFVGAIMLGCIFMGIEPFFELLPTGQKLMASIPIIYVLGSNVLFNMATGFNSEIISYSPYYRFNIVSVLILVVLNVSLVITSYSIHYTKLYDHLRLKQQWRLGIAGGAGLQRQPGTLHPYIFSRGPGRQEVRRALRDRRPEVHLLRPVRGA